MQLVYTTALRAFGIALMANKRQIQYKGNYRDSNK
jgi:hypothetical protein